MASISLKYKSKQGSLTAPGDVDPGAMIPIATTTLSTATATVTFSSIPQNYEHLQIRGIAQGSLTGKYARMRFNSDSGSNYAVHDIEGNGGSAPAYYYGSANGVYLFPSDIATATSVYSAFIIDILDYQNTNKNKVVRTLHGNDNNGSGIIYFLSGLWTNTNAITSIDFSLSGENFTQYSSFALYGIKRAGA